MYMLRALMPGWKLPTSTPMTMAPSTHTARKRSRNDIAVSTAAHGDDHTSAGADKCARQCTVGAFTDHLPIVLTALA